MSESEDIIKKRSAIKKYGIEYGLVRKFWLDIGA